MSEAAVQALFKSHLSIIILFCTSRKYLISIFVLTEGAVWEKKERDYDEIV